MEDTPRFVADSHFMLVSVDLESYAQRAPHPRRHQTAWLRRVLFGVCRDAGLGEPTDAGPVREVPAGSRRPAKRNAAPFGPRLPWDGNFIAIVGLGGFRNANPRGIRQVSGEGDEDSMIPAADRQLLAVAEPRPHTGAPLHHRRGLTVAVEIVAATVGQERRVDDWKSHLDRRFTRAAAAGSVRPLTTKSSGPQPPGRRCAVVTGAATSPSAEIPSAETGAGWWASSALSPDKRAPCRAGSAAPSQLMPHVVHKAASRCHRTHELGQGAAFVHRSRSARMPTAQTWLGNSVGRIDTEPVTDILRTPFLARAQSPPVPQAVSLTSAPWPSEPAAAAIHRSTGRSLRQCYSARAAEGRHAREQAAHRPARSIRPYRTKVVMLLPGREPDRVLLRCPSSTWV